MFESTALKITFHPPNHYSLTGRIDETFPVEIGTETLQDLIHLDFNGITYMNSIGILKFITFLTSLPRTTCIYYECVPTIVVSQMGIVKGIVTQRFKIKSFYVPYIDKEIQEQIMVLVNIDEVVNNNLPYKKHPQNGSLLEPDVQVDRFLKFLHHN
jgi:hypothetical protein